jgi:Bacterial Ig-like domain (group 2)/Putative Ig domain
MKWTSVRLMGLAILVITVTGCKDNPNVNVSSAPTVAVAASATLATILVADSTASTGPFTIAKGQTVQLVATGLDASNATISGISFVWSSSNPAIASVSSTGLVIGSSLGGPVTITASNGSITSNSISVTVSCAGIPASSPTPMTVTLNPASPMNVNAIASVTAAVYDCNGTPVPDNTSVLFTLNTSTAGNLSSGSSLATSLSVPTAGGAGLASASFVAGPSAGQVTITASSGTVSASVTVVINALPVLGIQFLQANPQVIGVKGSGQTEVSEVSFSVTDTQGNPFGDGLAVNFEFLNGLNPGGGAQIDPPAASTVGGVAKTFLKSGYVAGPVRILAYVDANKSGTFDPDPITNPDEVYSTSTPLSIGGGIPSARFFSISADVHNLAGFVYDGEVANINAKLADRFGNYNVLTGTSVSFYTEAGAIDRQGITDDKGQTTVELRTQNRWPFDTDPKQILNPIGNEIYLYNNVNCNGLDPGPEDVLGNFEDLNGNGVYDPCEHFKDLNGNGYDLGEPNPRDGWVTVLAVTQGEETFYDENGNGLYDPGERFDDNGGEPFIDENDNGLYDGPESFTDMNANNSYDPGEPFVDISRGEPFYDTNGNGTRDAGEPFTDLNGNLTYDSSGFPNYVYDHGEFFVDVNGNGKWDSGNGQWDSNTAIWVDLRGTNQTVKKSQTIVFTGEPDFSNETSRIVIDELHRDPRAGSGANYWIHNGECVNMSIHLADINNNALIPGTTIAISLDQGKLIGPSSVTIPDNYGGGPYVIGVGVCDDDASKIEMKSSSIKVDVTWTPQNGSTLLATMGASGIKDAPYNVTPTIVTTSLPSASIACSSPGQTPPCYNVTLNVTGGAAPYTWTVIAGGLPPSFVLDSATGIISQTADSSTAGSPYGFTVQVTDALGSTATQALSITTF